MLTPLRETRVSGSGGGHDRPIAPNSRKPLTQQRKAWSDATSANLQLQLIINLTDGFFRTHAPWYQGRCLTLPGRKRLGAPQHE